MRDCAGAQPAPTVNIKELAYSAFPRLPISILYEKATPAIYGIHCRLVGPGTDQSSGVGSGNRRLYGVRRGNAHSGYACERSLIFYLPFTLPSPFGRGFSPPLDSRTIT